MIITPRWFADFESRMRIITDNAYSRLSENLWYPVCTKFATSETKREMVTWLLSTARIRNLIDGEMRFSEIVSHVHEYTHDFAGDGLKLNKTELEDKDANGIDAVSKWSQDIGAYAAYWPQEKISEGILENPKCYDGLAYFHGAHPVNPALGASAGVYSNLLTGDSYAIHDSGTGAVELDVAVKNFSRVLTHVRLIKSPNNKTFRHLRPTAVLYPPAMGSRIQQLFDAKIIAQNASGGGAGSANVEAVIRNFNIANLVECPELSAAGGGSDTAYYVVCQDVVEGELGAWIYSEREAFNVRYHGPMTTAELSRTDVFEWHLKGRNAVSPGHPFGMFKVDPTE